MVTRSESVGLSPNQNAWFWLSFDSMIAICAALVCLVVEQAGSARFSEILALRISLKNVLLMLLFLPLWSVSHQLFELHNEARRLSRSALAIRGFGASLVGSVFFVPFPLFSHDPTLSIIRPVAIFFAVAYGMSLSARCMGLPILPRLRDARNRPSTLLIVGSGPLALRSYESILATSGKRLSVLGFVDSPGSHTIPLLIAASLVGSLEGLEATLMSTQVDEVLIALPFRSCYDKIQAAIATCERAGAPVSYHFQPFQHTLGYSQLQERALQLHLTRHPSRLADARLAKRAVDFVGAACCLLVFAPLFLLIAFAIKLDSRGPVLFAQPRYGKNKRLFRMFKFRTMVPDAESRQAALEIHNEAQGPVFKIKHDPRVTRLGKLLRKTSLDELPQLINVLRGEMSLVGPRPLPKRDVARFNDSWLMRRFSVKPGLTCLWQIRGRSNATFEQWIAYDLEYIDTWSPSLDIKILVKTIPSVLRGSGAM